METVRSEQEIRRRKQRLQTIDKNKARGLQLLRERRRHSLLQLSTMEGCGMQNIPLFEHQESVATTEARLRMEGVELKEEWQDEDFPR
ncbi:hypothetical protein cypCar_00028117 [Cyprinus carpio]|nr:hypothetical protein cypCar_00028117 [Cyprinus carpio]